MLKKVYTSLGQLQVDLDKFIYYLHTILKERIRVTGCVVKFLTRNLPMVSVN